MGDFFNPQPIGFSEGGGRPVKDAQEEIGVHEGVSTTSQKGIENSSKSAEITTKNS